MGGPYQTLLYGINNNGFVTGLALNPADNYYSTGFIISNGVTIARDRAERR